MPTGTALALGALVFALLFAVVGLVVFLEGRKRRVPAGLLYVIREAAAFAEQNVPAEVLERVGRKGVMRILEWSAHYLQGLAVSAPRRRGISVVAGGDPRAVEYIRAGLLKKGFDYSPADIEAVLSAEAQYLFSIGAVGEPAEEPVEVKEQV